MHAPEGKISLSFISKDFEIKLNYAEFVKLERDKLTDVCLKIRNSFNCTYLSSSINYYKNSIHVTATGLEPTTT